MITECKSYTYTARLERLREKKLQQTRDKLDRLGSQDEDDYGYVLPPEDFSWTHPVLDENGSFHGAEAWAKNFRSLMEAHPVYIDADDALAGRWMFMLSRMRDKYKLSLAPFPFDYSYLHEEQKLYDITCGIGKDAHFAPDYRIGLQLGWGGLEKKVEDSSRLHAGDEEAEELLNAELDAIAGIQSWIRRTAKAAQSEAAKKDDPERCKNLRQQAEINFRLVDKPPQTMREACQWIVWFNMASRTYNRDGAGGQLDELLRPFYENDLAEGILDDEAAIFYIACLLLNDPHYYQIGGPDRYGNDQTSKVSFLILEAAHRLKTSCNLTIRVFDDMDEKLFRRGLEVLMADRLGYPRFSGDKALVAGFMKNGFSDELARERIALGCNWMSLPGREYTLNDVVKINVAKVFEVAMHDILSGTSTNTELLFEKFSEHLSRAVACTAEGLDFHLKHQYRNEPELLLNLLCHGPIERGRDASHGGIDFYNMCIDGAGLAVVADSFAAIEQWLENEKALDWKELGKVLKNNFDSPEGERLRVMLQKSERFGGGDTLGRKWALRITECFTRLIKEYPVPQGRQLLPGWFSWADTLRFGKSVGALPNGRRAGEPISHGANPCPGFRRDGALTAVVRAVAEVQPGYGNTAPLQLEIDPGVASSEKNIETIGLLIKTHFEMGGTLVNINIVDAEMLRSAHRNPEKYPDLLVRVTGFSAYFASLSPEFRQLVIDRIIGNN